MLQSSQKMESFFNSYAVFAFFSIFTFTCSADNDYLYHFCSNSTNLAGNSAYMANLDHLLFSFANATVDTNYGLYNATVGKTPNIVYGYFLCRGDVSAEICHDCVTSAANDVARRCRSGYEAVIWYEECMIRYSNRSILTVMATEPEKSLRILQNVSEPDRLNELVAAAVKEIAARASNAPVGGKKFATKEVKFNEFQNIYSLAQCTPDISGADCRRCLEFAIGELPDCCSGKEGGLVFYPSCCLWYQLTPFYSDNEASTPPPTPPPVSPVHPPFLVNSGKRRSSSSIIVGIIVSIVCFIVILSGFLYWKLMWKSRKKSRPQMEQNVGTKTGDQRLQFELSIIRTATDNFADANVVGRGGFGTVYKGVFANGQEIAVKRLSRSSSGQGPEEFKNEVVLVAHLQHRNLVRLLGYCAEGNERMLIFEFVPNRSLDYYLFDPQKRGELDWPKRLTIIKGIARGLLYLHTDSRVKIIHRDVKASNILLDEDMTPKITDFGMARIIEENQTQEPTKRVVGTYGYISPEFAMNGKFSEKSDVFSFGVLMLEIVCGKRNTGLSYSNAENLLTYAWKHWKDGTVLELMDPTLRDSYVSDEVTRCIQIGLLCVQESPTTRPTMGRVVLMLSSFSVTLPAPLKTAFFFGSTTGMSCGGSSERGPDRNANISNSFSVDDASITSLHPR